MMMTRCDIAIDAAPLKYMNGVIVQSITEVRPNTVTNAMSRGGREGQLFLDSKRTYRDVIVEFVLSEKDPEERAQTMDEITAWAMNGRKLTVSYRPGKYLMVHCEKLPDVEARKWTNKFSITFRAYECPYWTEEYPRSASAPSSKTASIVLNMSGTVDTELWVEAKSPSGTCNTVTISCNGRTISFKELGLAAGETLMLRYSDRSIQEIVIRRADGTERSAMSKREGTSADELLLHQGANTIDLSASNALEWKCYGFGRFY